MMDLKQIEEYIVANGVPVTRSIYAGEQKLRVMDVTSLPSTMREHFDERGFYKGQTQEAPKEQPETKGGKK